MLSAFANCFKIPELRQRIIFTLCVVVVVRIGAAIPCPGINTEILARFFHSVIEKDPNNTVVGLFNLFSGGALENCAVFTLGIIPYISASIMLQLMTAVVPVSASSPVRKVAAKKSRSTRVTPPSSSASSRATSRRGSLKIPRTASCLRALTRLPASMAARFPSRSSL